MRLSAVPRSVRSALAVAVALAIAVASVVTPPASGAPDLVLGLPLDKWLHAVGYAVLAFAIGFARLARDPRALALAWLLAAAYGLGIEGVQAFLPARSFDPLDMVANAVGAGIGTVVWWVVARRGLDGP
ncbi:VanZ family protein [Natronomonas sp. EA1]|uniref:VanZ family protein n=1 Tax=Natronomonas sp. EA1 TaxID=3421655 RepID=UPI003EBCD42B